MSDQPSLDELIAKAKKDIEIAAAAWAKAAQESTHQVGQLKAEEEAEELAKTTRLPETKTTAAKKRL